MLTSFQAQIRILHSWSTQLTKFHNTPHFPMELLGTVYMMGAKSLYPRDGDLESWIVQKYQSSITDSQMKLALTEMQDSKVYEHLKVKEPAEGEEPQAKKQKRSADDDNDVQESLSIHVQMGGKKPPRPTMWLDDVHFMLTAAQNHAKAVGSGDGSEEDENIVKDWLSSPGPKNSKQTGSVSSDQTISQFRRKPRSLRFH